VVAILLIAKNIYPKTAQIARGTIAEWDREFGIYEDPE